MPIGWITLVLAFLVAAMTFFAATGRLPANGMIGFRTPATQRSDAAWIAGHRAAAWLVLPASLVVAGLGAAVGRGRSIGDLSGESTGGALLVAYGALLVAAAVIANRAARRVPASRQIPHAT